MASIDPTKVDNINTVTKAANGASKSDKAAKTLIGNYDDFLKLLTTQLQNQDPTDPVKAETFTAQIASLSQVEQQVNTNKNLETLVNLISGTQLNNSVNYIGKEVDAEGNSGVLTSAGATFGYKLDAAAENVAITITDSGGRTVFTGEGSKNAGNNVIIWDGSNSISGEKMPAGTYTIAVKAKDGAGKDITSSTYTTGVVSSVDMQDGVATLSIGDIKVPMDKVSAIRNPAA